MASFSEKLIEAARVYDLLGSLTTNALMGKQKWFAIRDNYRKTLKTRSDAPYKYEDVLSFLTPFISQREPLPNIVTVDNAAEEEMQDQQVEELTDEFTPFDIDSAGEVQCPPSCDTGCQSHCIATVLQNYLQRKDDREVRHRDHLTIFFEAMEATVRTLKPDLQIEVKKQIALLVMDNELKNIMPETPIQPLSSLAPSSTSPTNNIDGT